MGVRDLRRRRRLILQVERDVVALSYVRTVLSTATATLVDHRRELLALKGRIRRAQAKR